MIAEVFLSFEEPLVHSLRRNKSREHNIVHMSKVKQKKTSFDTETFKRVHRIKPVSKLSTMVDKMHRQ